MQHNGSRAVVLDEPESSGAPETLLWFEAIARKRCVSVTYNGVEAKLAPHVLYTRADQLYLAAVIVERRGVRVAERKIGIFKIAGLRDRRLLDQAFSTEPGFDLQDPRFVGTTVFSVEP